MRVPEVWLMSAILNTATWFSRVASPAPGVCRSALLQRGGQEACIMKAFGKPQNRFVSTSAGVCDSMCVTGLPRSRCVCVCVCVCVCGCVCVCVCVWTLCVCVCVCVLGERVRARE